MTKMLTVVVGAGGTGSYFIPNLLQRTNKNFIDNKIIVMDGDYLEERNLLRQGFFKGVVNNSKSEAMYKMHSRYYNGFFECQTTFLSFADEILNLVESQEMTFDTVLLVSCVDNNLARLRLLLAQQMLKQAYPTMHVLFADSGNEEWFGQTILLDMKSEDKPFIIFTKNEFELVTENILEHHDTIFAHISDWKNNLTRGDHEMSCDDVVESAPQNIATNMMASNVLLYTILNTLETGNVQNVYFDCKTNKTMLKSVSERSTLTQFLTELVEYLKEDSSSVLSERFIARNKESETLFVKQPIRISTGSQQQEQENIVDFDTLFNQVFFKEEQDLLNIGVSETKEQATDLSDELHLELFDEKDNVLSSEQSLDNLSLDFFNLDLDFDKSNNPEKGSNKGTEESLELEFLDLDFG